MSDPSPHLTSLITTFAQNKAAIETLVSSPLSNQFLQTPSNPTPISGTSSHFSPMAITPETPNAAHNVAIPMETSPPVQIPMDSAAGENASNAIVLTGERVEPLEIVEPVLIDDLPRTEKTTVNFPQDKTPTVASEKGSSSAAKPRGKRTKVMTDGPRRASRRLAAARGCPTARPFKKRRTSYINISDEEVEATPNSPTTETAQTSGDSSDSGSEFDDTESDQDFKGDGEAVAGSSDDDSLASDETLHEWVKKKEKTPRSVPTSQPTKGETSRRGKKPTTTVSDSETESDNLDGYDPIVYSDRTADRWESMGSRQCLAEKKIDRCSFDNYNMTAFLIQCGMMPTVSYAAPFAENVVKRFYANISKKFWQEDSKQYGNVNVRGSVFNITPAKINLFFGMDEGDDDDEPLDNMNEVVQHITGGRVNIWSSGVKVSDLTSLHNVLHKLTITNWLPSSNSTSVTDSQAVLIYKLSCGVKVDFGRMVFKKIRQAAKSNTGILPYPSLIYKLLCAQKAIQKSSDILHPTGTFKIQSTYVSGDCVVDLPWVDPRLPQRSDADVEDSVESGDATYSVPKQFLQKELERCEEQIRIFSTQLHQAQETRSRLMALLSHQKGGDGGASGSGTAGEEQEQGQEGRGAGDGGDGVRFNSEDEREADFEKEIRELYGDDVVNRARGHV